MKKVYELKPFELNTYTHNNITNSDKKLKFVKSESKLKNTINEFSNRRKSVQKQRQNGQLNTQKGQKQIKMVSS